MQDTTGHRQLCAAELPDPGRLDRAAKTQGHRLEAVADAEDRDPGVEQGRVDGRRLVGVNTGRSTRKDDRGRVAGDQLLDGLGVRNDLGVHLRLTDPPGDQLGVLRAEVDHEHGPGTGVGHFLLLSDEPQVKHPRRMCRRTWWVKQLTGSA
jgi:hypothetical protein